VSTEYGCSEAGKSFEGNNETKLLHERGIKALKMMKDMFYSLCEAIGNEEKKIRKLQSIGFIHSGRSNDIIAQIRFPCWLYIPNNLNKNVRNLLKNNTIWLKNTSCNYVSVKGK
ncbi:9168_t:CDS:2, partial [Funneliformis caledonium]